MPGPDIFLSYNREDSDRAKQFAEGFAAEGLDVWWDVALRSGEAYDEVTENALRNARAVVVLWSKKSVVSRWVRAEATLAERKKTLMPAMIEECERPIMFELVQTADLSDWRGDTSEKAWQDFARHVCEFVGKEAQAPKPKAKDEPLPGLDQVSLVVLPFANMSRDEDQEYFADGITEDVITDLSKVSALGVISRNSSFTFKGKTVDIPEVARQLNVTHVLEGSVRKAGNRVRVTAQLIDGSSNNHVWAERWDRDLDDIFELQDELSEAIVEALKLNLLPREKKAIEGRGTSNLEAYDLFSRARALHSTAGHHNLLRAMDLYREATNLDPDFAQAWAGLAHSIQFTGVYEPKLFKELWDEFKAASRKSIELAPKLPMAILTAGQVAAWEYNWDEVARIIDSTDFELGAEQSIKAHFALLLGRANEGAELALRGREVDPLSIGNSFGTQYILDAAGRLDEAEAEYERSKDLEGPRVTMEWRAITRAMVRGDHERVWDIFRNRWDRNDHFMPFRNHLIEVRDKPEEALAILHEALEDPAYQDGSRMGAIATWAVYYGDIDMALEAFRRGPLTTKHYIGFLEMWFPQYAELRQDPRFKQLLIDSGIVDHWRKTGNWGDFARPVGDADFEIIA